MILHALYGITAASQLIIDPFLVITTILLITTLGVVLLYYNRIKKASKAYEESRNIVTDVIVSFDRQVQRHDEHLVATTQKLENLTMKSETLEQRVDRQETRREVELEELKSQITKNLGFESLKNQLESVNAQIEELTRAQEEFKQRPMAVSDLPIETAIPIRREHALAPLTETELRVLEFIAAEGEKTAPQIREMIRLTREHTARLMKKLYEAGYLERRSDKAPYAYRVKEEMLRILKKSEIN